MSSVSGGSWKLMQRLGAWVPPSCSRMAAKQQQEQEQEQPHCYHLPSFMTPGMLARALGVQTVKLVPSLERALPWFANLAGRRRRRVLTEMKRLPLDYDECAAIVRDWSQGRARTEHYDLEEELALPTDAPLDDLHVVGERRPVVCVMGHLDHGKTTLVDALGGTRVATQEAGRITQSVNCSVLPTATLLDTPGHAVFEKMRDVGGYFADTVLLVVSADPADGGWQAQTTESLAIAEEYGARVVCLITKVDVAADIDRFEREEVRTRLPQDAHVLRVSAVSGDGLDAVREVLADVYRGGHEHYWPRGMPVDRSEGAVIDSFVSSRGQTVRVLLFNGELRVGDHFAAGAYAGTVKRMWATGYTQSPPVVMAGQAAREQVDAVGPGMPVDVFGMEPVSAMEAFPEPGEPFVSSGQHPLAAFATLAVVRRLQKSRAREDEAGEEREEGSAADVVDDEEANVSIVLRAGNAANLETLQEICRAPTEFVRRHEREQGVTLLEPDDGVVPLRVVRASVGALTPSDVRDAALFSGAAVCYYGVKPVPQAVRRVAREKGVTLWNIRVLTDLSALLVNETNRRRRKRRTT